MRPISVASHCGARLRLAEGNARLTCRAWEGIIWAIIQYWVLPHPKPPGHPKTDSPVVYGIRSRIGTHNPEAPGSNPGPATA